MDKDHLPLLEDQNPVRRSEIFAGSRSATLALTEAIKSLSNVSGREADVIYFQSITSEADHNRIQLHLFIFLAQNNYISQVRLV